MSISKIYVEIVRDMWVGPVDGEGGNADNRLRKGKRMEVDMSEEILAGIETGALRRVKPEEIEAEKEAKAKK